MDMIKFEDTYLNVGLDNFKEDKDVTHEVQESSFTEMSIVEETKKSVMGNTTVTGIQDETADKHPLPSTFVIKEEMERRHVNPELHFVKTDNDKNLASNVLNELHCKRQKSNLKIKNKKKTNKRNIIKKNLVKCKICDENFTKAALQLHKSLHKAPYVCNVCNKTFSDKNYYVYTHKITHTKRQRYVCDLCDKSFANKSTIRSHLSSHTDIWKPSFICFDCNKHFTKKCHLVEHHRIHTGYKPYKCNICDKRFTFKSCWNKHKNIHKAGLHKCGDCSMNFRKQMDLEKHLRSHSAERRHTCSQCSMKFVKSSHLKEHLRKHTGERPYKCAECGRAFAHNNTLTKHKRIHTGERPYTCDVCGHGFLQIGNYKQHLAKHTNTSDSCLEGNVKYVYGQDPLTLLHLQYGS